MARTFSNKRAVRKATTKELEARERVLQGLDELTFDQEAELEVIQDVLSDRASEVHDDTPELDAPWYAYA